MTPVNTKDPETHSMYIMERILYLLIDSGSESSEDVRHRQMSQDEKLHRLL